MRTAIVLAVGVGLWLAGQRLGRKRSFLGMTAAVACVVIVVALLALRFFPNAEIRVAAMPGYLDGRFFLPFGFSLVVFGIGFAQARKRWGKWLLAAVSLIGLMGGCFWSALIDFAPYGQLNGEAEPGPPTLQSAEWSCVPAAGAAWLRARGVLVSERDLARACRSTLAGTDSVALARGLLRYLPEPKPRVRVARRTWEELPSLPMPCLAVFNYDWPVDHVVVFRRLRGEFVEYFDPGQGETLKHRSTFEVRWTGEVLLFEGQGRNGGGLE